MKKTKLYPVLENACFEFSWKPPGLIIGPRGNTQKRLERETDCKIAIRGKGSVKEGARRGPTVIDEDDELHVYISGETEDAVTKVRSDLYIL